MGVRTYARHDDEVAARNRVRVHKQTGSLVTTVELLQDTIDNAMFAEILAAVQPGRLHVFVSACDNFNVGASAGGKIDVAQFLDAIGGYGAMQQALAAKCDLPVLCLCHGSYL